MHDDGENNGNEAVLFSESPGRRQCCRGLMLTCLIRGLERAFCRVPVAHPVLSSLPYIGGDEHLPRVDVRVPHVMLIACRHLVIRCSTAGGKLLHLTAGTPRGSSLVIQQTRVHVQSDNDSFAGPSVLGAFSRLLDIRQSVELHKGKKPQHE